MSPHSHEPPPEGFDEILPQVPTEAHPIVLLGQKIVLAGASNAMAAMVTNPMDLIKVRQQLRLSSPSSTTSPSSWPSILRLMVQQEGFFSIYKGLSASLLREGSYSGIRMGAYDGFKGIIMKMGGRKKDEREGFGIKLLAGMCSGMCGAAIANPADLLKVRLQSPSATGTLRNHISTIYSSQGPKGFYVAVFPTILRAGILTSAQLGTYDQSKHLLMVDFPELFQEGFQTHLVASGMAGFACSAASSPVDVVKVRMMTDHTNQYRSSLHCVTSLLKNEGPLVFYKGFTMCFLRLWPHSVISLLAFEQLRKLAGLRPI